MNCTRPRMFELLLVERPRKPEVVEDAMLGNGRWGYIDFGSGVGVGVESV